MDRQLDGESKLNFCDIERVGEDDDRDDGGRKRELPRARERETEKTR